MKPPFKMLINKHYLIFVVLSLFFLACADENLNDIAANQFVVEAFIYAGEPIDDIRIKSTFPLSEEDDLSTPINNAQVTIIKEGQRFDLMPSGNDGFYNYPGNDVSIETGDVFQLEVIHNGITATAETVVPTPTRGLQISTDSLKVPLLPFSQGRDAIVATIQNFLMNSRIEATWENQEEDLYFMVVEIVDDNMMPIFPDQVLEALSPFRFVSEPTTESSITFLGGSLVSFGTYAIKVYHINQEYAALYENRNQDSRDLNEPPSNINNALGVFSAFNSQEALFQVVRE